MVGIINDFVTDHVLTMYKGFRLTLERGKSCAEDLKGHSWPLVLVLKHYSILTVAVYVLTSHLSAHVTFS